MPNPISLVQCFLECKSKDFFPLYYTLVLAKMTAKMIKILTLLLAAAIPVLTAEIPLDKILKPELSSESVETHAVFKKNSEVETEHPVYKGDQPQARAHIEPVRPKAPVISHDPMLADQPVGSDVNRVDELTIPGYGFVPAPVETYSDVPYAPGYLYDSRYTGANNYEVYENPHNYLMEPDVSTFSLLWSQVPDSRTFVSYIGRAVHYVFSGIFVILLGTLITVGVCSYTNLCTISFNGVGPIHEEMRSLMSPERLERISNAADFVKTAIDKYQKIQKVSTPISDGLRKRRAIFL